MISLSSIFDQTSSPRGRLFGRARPARQGLLASLSIVTFIFFLCGAPTSKADTPKRIVVLGDSIAAGFGVDPDEAYPAALQRKIDETKLPYTVVNAGVSGDTTAGGLRRVDWILK